MWGSKDTEMGPSFTETRVAGWFMVFNTTFNNISAIS